MKHWNAVAVYDTAGAAKMIRLDNNLMDPTAIASVTAAKIYGLRVIKKSIEDNKFNFTRFLVLSREAQHAKHNAKTSLIFILKSKPGALFRALGALSFRDIDLTKIESRPIAGKPWEYIFYVDLDGTVLDENCQNAIEHLKELTTHLRVLGSYTKAKEPS